MSTGPKRRSRKEVRAELVASGTLVVTDEDRRITHELTCSSVFADELRAMGESDPDLAES